MRPEVPPPPPAQRAKANEGALPADAEVRLVFDEGEHKVRMRITQHRI